jgi:hypothetical protein
VSDDERLARFRIARDEIRARIEALKGLLDRPGGPS